MGLVQPPTSCYSRFLVNYGNTLIRGGMHQAPSVSGNAKPKQGTMKPELKRIRKVEYDIDPNRYELRSGSETNAPLCPYGNIYKWVVFDLKANEYVRFAKSVFKLLINKNGK